MANMTKTKCKNFIRKEYDGCPEACLLYDIYLDDKKFVQDLGIVIEVYKERFNRIGFERFLDFFKQVNGIKDDKKLIERLATVFLSE